MQEFNFGENLRIIRQAKGISQEAMAIGLNMSQSRYSKLERKPDTPNPDLVNKLCKLLDTAPSVILSGREIKDLLPKDGFEHNVKEIMNTTIGKVFFWMLLAPFINAAYYTVYGFCEGLRATEQVQKIAPAAAGFAAIIFAYYWMKRMQKGKK